MIREQPAALGPRFGRLTILEQRSKSARALEKPFETGIDALLADAGGRWSRSKTDDEALFYLATGHMLRARYRFDHDKGMWGAARDGASAKRYSEAFVAKHPESGDGLFILGAYNYYVELAPSFMKVLRFLLFIPSGNRVEGLKQIERAYRDGSLFSFPAGMLLLEIYGSFEGRPGDGVRIGERYAREFPDNPEVQFALAELYANPGVEDFERAAQQYAALAAALAAKPDKAEGRYRAVQGLASTRLQQWRVDDSIGVLSGAIDAPDPKAPAWVLPAFLLQRANLRALADDPKAGDDLKRVLGDSRWKEQHPRATNLTTWMLARRTSGEAAVYAALIPGNRLVTSRRYPEARQAYDDLQRRHPTDPQVRYRLAILTFVSSSPDRALPEFQAVAAGKDAPNWLKAGAWLHIGRAHNLAGRREEARKAYQHVVDTYEREGSAWGARLGLVTPYKRPAAL